MFDIDLPCCGTPAPLDEDADRVRCDECGLELDLAPDARPAARAERSIELVALAA